MWVQYGSTVSQPENVCFFRVRLLCWKKELGLFGAAGPELGNGLISNERCEKRTSGAEQAAEKLGISVERGEEARPRLKPVLILLALCGG